MYLTAWSRLMLAGVAFGLANRPARAQEDSSGQGSLWPRCTGERDGQTHCGDGTLCTCHYDTGGALTGRAAGWRWSCDILRMCGEPAPAGPEPQPVPPGYGFYPSGPDTVQMPTLAPTPNRLRSSRP